MRGGEERRVFGEKSKNFYNDYLICVITGARWRSEGMEDAQLTPHGREKLVQGKVTVKLR